MLHPNLNARLLQSVLQASLCIVLLMALQACMSGKYKKVEKRDTIQAYEEFISKYPDKTEYANRAKNRIKELNWSSAQRANTIEAYESFLKKYPNESYYGPEAGKNLDDLRFQKATKINTISAYKEYLGYYRTDGRHTQEANRYIDDLEFEKAKRIHTAMAYYDYLSLYKWRGIHTDEAAERMKLLEWDSASRLNTVEAYQTFLSRYPSDYSLSAKAKAKIDELDFTRASSLHTIEAYNTYITSHQSDGRYVREAKSRIQALSWESAISINTVDSYWEFLTDYPNDSDMSTNAKYRLINLLFEGNKKKTGLVPPDQELFNNIAYFYELLSVSPSDVLVIDPTSYKFSMSNLSQKSRNFLNSFWQFITRLIQHEINIIALQKVGKYPAQEMLKDFLQGGSKGVELLSTFMKKEDAFFWTGTGNVIKGLFESQKREANAKIAIQEERYKQEVLAEDFHQTLQNQRKFLDSLTIRHDESGAQEIVQSLLNQIQFLLGGGMRNRDRLYKLGLLRTLPTNSEKSSSDFFANSAMPEMNIVLLNYQMSRYFLDSEREQHSLKVLLQWPTIVDKNHPIYSLVLNDLAYLATLKNENLNAEDFAGKAIHINRQNSRAWNNRAMARLRLGKIMEALFDIKEAIKIDSKEPWWWFSRARILASGFGKRGEAVDAIEKAIALGFKDFERLKNDQELSFLHGYDRFDNLIRYR